MILTPPSSRDEAESLVDLLDRWLRTDSADQIAILPTGLAENDQLNLESSLQDLGFLNNESALVLATSGTSSDKADLVVLSQRAIRSSVSSTEEWLGEPGLWVLSLPLAHIAGLQVVLRSLLAGHRPVIPSSWPKYSPRSLARAVVESKSEKPNLPVYTSVVTPQLAALLEDPQSTEVCTDIDGILLGGGRIESNLLEHARSKGLRIVCTYGMTETAGGCVYNGQALSNTQIRLDAETEQILIRSGGLMFGYLNRDPDWVVIDGQKYLRTSDVGMIKPDGNLIVTGRLDDIVNSGGSKVHLQRVRSELLELEGVRDCAVCALPHPVWGQVVSALVVADPKKHLSADALYTSMSRRLGPSHTPRVIVFADSIEKTELGKTKTAKVRMKIEHAIRSGSAWQR